MKKSIYFIPVVILLIATLLLTTLSVSAQDDGANLNASTTIDASLQKKVDAGNALNVRSTESTDSDGDGYGDSYSEMPPRDIDKPSLMQGEDGYIPSIREGGRTVEAGNIPETVQQQNTGNGDVDGDGYGDASVTEPDYLDDDSDDDSIGDETRREIEVVEYRDGDSSALIEKDVDKATPKLMEALSIDATTPLFYQGIKIRITAESCDSRKSGDCDDGDSREENSPSASFSMNISGVTVRGWDPQQKQELQNRASKISTVETPNDFGIWLATKVLENESISAVNVIRDSIEIKYEAKARLFGFIPITMPTTARLGRMKISDITLERSSLAEVEIDYPWYGFLVRKNSVSKQIASHTLEIENNYQASQTKEAKFKAGKALADTVK